MMLLPFEPTNHIFKIGRALRDTEISSLYALAAAHKGPTVASGAGPRAAERVVTFADFARPHSDEIVACSAVEALALRSDRRVFSFG